MPRVPAYLDAFVEAVRQGVRIDHVHLGHWDKIDSPRGTPEDFAAAQERLAAKLVGLADLRPGQLILDVGCGFGGLARLIDGGLAPVGVVGANIDARQLAACQALRAHPRNTFDWVAADACALPFANAVFDRVFCVEAMFHFDSRALFLAEAFRVLKRGGSFVASDILLRRPPVGFAFAPETIEAVLERDLGPWPEKWLSRADLRTQLGASGFQIEVDLDVTAETLPSYRTMAPAGFSAVSGPVVMRALHEQGCLQYVYLRAGKP